MRRFIIGSLAALGISQAANAATYFTKKCAQFGHPEFQITISDKAIPQTDVDWFLSVLEEMVATGERFKPGETMQFGWMLTMLQEGENGTLKITEPDLKVVPIKFVDSVDATIKFFRAQKDSVESVFPGDALTFPSIVQSVVVHVNYKKSRRVVLERFSPQDLDSGWWLSDLSDGDGNQDAARFTKISLYQLGLDRPDLIKFLAFPAGVQVVVDRRVIVLKDGQELPMKSGSFLYELNRGGTAK